MIQLYDKNFRNYGEARSISDLMLNYSSYLPSDRSGVYYSINHVFPGHERSFESLASIAFDIDDVLPEDLLRTDDYLATIANVLGVERELFHVVCSGNGIHFIIELAAESIISDKNYFQEKRSIYRYACKRLDESLKMYGLSGKFDPEIFKHSASLRVPGSINCKGDTQKDCTLIQLAKEPILFTIDSVASARPLKLLALSPDTSNKSPGDAQPLAPSMPNDGILYDATFKWHIPDNKAIVEGCEFIKWTSTNQSSVSEAQWYAMLGIVGFLAEPTRWAHAYSKDHPKYTPQETEKKLSQVHKIGKPRTCKDISTRWDSCKDCKFWGKIHSPFGIKSKDYIKTESTGFYKIKTDSKGKETLTPAIQDLYLAFCRDHIHKYFPASQEVRIWKDHFWQYMPEYELHAWAHAKLTPKVEDLLTTKKFVEFIYRAEQTNMSFLHDTTNKKLNCLNGVLDLSTNTLLEHSPLYGFTSKLPFNYDPTAKAPQFEQFLDTVTCGDINLKDNLMHYLAYIMVGSDKWNDRILILSGDGSNGKTTFIKIVKELLGDDSFTDVSPYNLDKPFSMKSIEHKKLAIFEEMPANNSRQTWETLKSLASGGSINVAEKFKPEYSIKNTAKIIMLCNVLPYGTDASHGFFRRLLVVPFDKRITEIEADLGLADRIISSELPGILNLCLQAIKELEKNNYRILIKSDRQKEVIQEYMENKSTSFGFMQHYFEKWHEIGDLTDYYAGKKWSNLGCQAKSIGGYPDVPCIKISDAYQVYRFYCQKVGIRPFDVLSLRNFASEARSFQHLLGFGQHICKFDDSSARAFTHVIPNQQWAKDFPLAQQKF